jgi:hypothetical protein
VVRLFHPRQDRWDEHFQCRGVRIEGITATGRATIRLFAMNDIRRLELRAELETGTKFPRIYVKQQAF